MFYEYMLGVPAQNRSINIVTGLVARQQESVGNFTAC